MIITPAVMYLSGTRRNGTGVNLGVIYRGVIAKGVNVPGHIYQGVIVPGLMSYIPHTQMSPRHQHQYTYMYDVCTVRVLVFVRGLCSTSTYTRIYCVRAVRALVRYMVMQSEFVHDVYQYMY